MVLKELKGLKGEELEERLREMVDVSPPRVETLPYLTKGFTLEDIGKNEKGFAIFEVKGKVVKAQVTAKESISQYSACYVIHPRSPIKVFPGTADLVAEGLDFFKRKRETYHTITTAVGSNRTRRIGVDAIYEAEKWKPFDWFVPSTYWYNNRIHCPNDIKGLSFRTKRTFNHMTFKGKLPNPPSDGQRAWIGLENGEVVGTGISSFTLQNNGGNIELYAVVGSSFKFRFMDITSELPSDYDTADHVYTVQALQNWSEFYIDHDLVAVGFNGYNLNIPSFSPPPYAINDSYESFTQKTPGLVELIGDYEGLEWDIKPVDVRFTRMGLFPSRVWRLHDSGADTLMTEGTYDTGSLHWSHPIPTLGYKNKTFKFRADTDSMTDGLRIGWYDQEGHMLYLVKKTYDAGEDYVEKITGDHPMMRLGYEPASDGASITYAEVVLSGEPS